MDLNENSKTDFNFSPKKCLIFALELLAPSPDRREKPARPKCSCCWLVQATNGSWQQTYKNTFGAEDL